jgi:hypothetical protein
MQSTLNGDRAALELLEKNPATGATFVFRQEFVTRIIPIPEEWVHDAWIAFLVATQSRLRTLPERLISYRLHPGQQIGLAAGSAHVRNDAEREKAALAFHDLLIKRWSLMAAKLGTLPVDPVVIRVVQQRVKFLQDRTALRQRKALGRIVAATATLPGYFRFSRGLLSYCRDVAGTHH